MSKISSKTGKIKHNDERIFNFLSDFDNFEQIVPKDKVSDWSSTGDSCSFKVDGIGSAGMKIIEKEPNKLIKITSEQSPVSFSLWIQLKKIGDWDTRIKITVEPQINEIMLGMVKKPLKSFVDSLIDQVESFPF